MNTTKTILLMRHGKPKLQGSFSFFTIGSGYDLKKFIDKYNGSEIEKENIPIGLYDAIKGYDCYLCSGLARTCQSYELLGISKYEKNTLLNEAELPSDVFNNLFLPVFLWLILLRAVWLCGYKSNSESYADFKIRIKKVYELLQARLENSDNIAVMAHGYLNNVLAKLLVENGWEMMEKTKGNGYWSIKKLQKKI